MEIEPTAGGFRKPISILDFVIQHLIKVGEDHASAMHKAYKQALREVELPASRRGRPYKACTYYSFSRQLQAMKLQGIVIKTERSEASDSVHTEHWDIKPQRYYYRLA